METRESNVGTRQRVHPKVEELVKIVADRLGLLAGSVRNVAILLGLLQIVQNGFPVWNDSEFFGLLKQVEKVVKNDGKEGKEGEKKTG